MEAVLDEKVASELAAHYGSQIYIVVVREPRGALRAEDTVPGWGDMTDEQLMYLGRSQPSL